MPGGNGLGVLGEAEKEALVVDMINIHTVCIQHVWNIERKQYKYYKNTLRTKFNQDSDNIHLSLNPTN